MRSLKEQVLQASSSAPVEWNSSQDSTLHYRLQRFILDKLCWSHGLNAHQHLEWKRFISRYTSLFLSSFIGLKSEFTPRPSSKANLSTINRDTQETPPLSQTETLMLRHFWAPQCRKEPLLFLFLFSKIYSMQVKVSEVIIILLTPYNDWALRLMGCF